ncbi:isopenicillin N synthase family oxygenase [Rhodobacteraceae bacterium]|nr:isopenicillin N synthase family oxygenase [Paracoccaceae bacterium]
MTDTQIPVLDWSRFTSDSDKAGFVADLSRACRDTGFFLMTGHGIPQSLIDETLAAADQLFALPTAEKAKLDIRTIGNNRGWSGPGTENLDDSKPDQVDRKEAFNTGLEFAPADPRLTEQPFRGMNAWPDLPSFRDTVMAYFEAVHDLGVDLHRAIALDLGLPEHYFAPYLDEPLATLRMLRYPGGGGDGIGAGAHTDYGSITVLYSDGEPGLQVQPRGKDWVDVPSVPGAFIINIADCLMRWTNDIYVSTPHRVLIPQNTRRSLAFFLDPNPDAVIKALPGTGGAKYPPVTGAEYLKLRLDATYTEKVTT